MVIKMATLAPEGSSWFRVLQEMGEEWRKASDGAVTLRIYPGGVAGDEDAMIRKMRIGQIQAAAITGIGLAYLEPSFYALHIPMMYESDEEFDYVRDRYAPVLERKMEEKGFVVLNWGDAGWVHFFSKDPVVTPEEAKALKTLPVGGGHEPGAVVQGDGVSPRPPVHERPPPRPADGDGERRTAPLRWCPWRSSGSAWRPTWRTSGTRR